MRQPLTLEEFLADPNVYRKARALTGMEEPPQDEGVEPAASLAPEPPPPSQFDEMTRRYVEARDKGRSADRLSGLNEGFKDATETILSARGMRLGRGAPPPSEEARARQAYQDDLGAAKTQADIVKAARVAAPTPGVRQKSTDPVSPESIRAQGIIKGILGDHFTDEQIGLMTEADIDSVLKYGTPAAQREVQREGQLATTQRSRASLEQSAQQFAAREGREWAKLSQDERQFYLRMAHEKEMEALKAENKAKEGIEGDVADAGKDLEDIGGMKTDLETLVLASKEADIPGAGLYDSRKPPLLQSKADTKTIQAARGIVGRLIKAQSGSAASEQEVTRKMEELGILGGTEQQFTIGLARLTEDARHVMENKQAKWRPEVLERYMRRGGTVAGDLPTTKPKPKPKHTSTKPPLQVATPDDKARVMINGVPKRIPRANLEKARAIAKQRGDTFEVTDG